ncbi:permease prefix domain 1-containing protein [Oceanobacillus sp. AG]|uniref:HAAS signaling domain-containing protein n=1 Tax=Oceanobacillus sp. AG TaxID=2681969 RepID=UPI0012EB972B|nr:permease prefix domain 1-containing protein [Oceanobacillus sp. AG]
MSKLSDNLKSLPEEERKSIVEEIEIHLKDKVDSLKNEGYSNEGAVSKMLSEFKSPDSLAKDYLKEYQELEIEERPNITFYLLNAGLTGLAFLSLPILEKQLELAWIALGVPLVICGFITLFLLKEQNKSITSILKISPKILLSLYFPVSLLFLWITFNQEDGFVDFSFYYMLIYWLTLLIYYIVTKKTTKKVSQYEEC